MSNNHQAITNRITTSRNRLWPLLLALLLAALASVPPTQAAQTDPPLGNITAVAAGVYHSCGLTSSGGVVCWGYNYNGQLGDGSTTERHTPVAVSGLSSGVSALAAGYYHTCAVTSSGGVVCWGYNYNGQLGDGSTTDHHTPVAVSGLSSGVSALAAGGYHTCAVTSSGGVVCWGNNYHGQLGDGTTTERHTPVAVSGLSSGVSAVAAGQYHTCAVTSSGGVQCWGRNIYGQLGDGTTTYRHTPVAVSGLSSGVSAVAASLYHTCAVTSSGVECWGLNHRGQLGDGSTTPSTTPVAVSGLSSGVSALAVGESHTCGRINSGGVQCWGYNYNGQLGDGSTTNRTTPVVVIDPDQVSGSSAPSLSVADATVDASNGTMNVPVDFVGNGANIASLAFSIDYDASCLSYDSYSGVPAGFAEFVNHDAADTDGELDVSILDATAPIGTLADGTLINLTFNVLPACITIDGTTTDTALNFSSDPSPSFGGTDAGEIVGDPPSNGTVTMEFNATPTDIGLDNNSVDENEAVGTGVGALSTTDLDTGDSHTYALVSGTGDDDNGSFTLDGNQVETAETFDFESKNSYTIRVRTTDDGGLNGSFEKQLTITVNDVNDAPTDLALDNSSVAENAPVDTLVGSLSSTDQDSSDSHSYALVAGTGDDDNGSFTIDGTQIKTSAIFDFEAKSSYTVRVRTTDNGTPNLSFEKQLTITIIDVNEAPVAQDDTVDPLVKVLVGTEAYNIDVLANDSDPENDSLTVASVTQPAAGSTSDNDSDVSFTAPNSNGSSTFTYQATDGEFNSNDATVTVFHVQDDPRGDCNGNGSVTAADFIAIVLEIFDASSDPLHNGDPAWWRIFDGGYAGSPLGCDANDSKNGAGNDSESVTVADLSCTVLRFFGASDCSGGTLSTPNGVQEAATLSTQQDANGGEVQVLLDSHGNEVASAAFSLVLDPQAVAFDATDADGDGVPDAVVVNVPAHLSRIVIWDAERSELHVAIFGISAELATLEDGALATVRLDAAAEAVAGGTNGRSPLTFGHMSLGNTQGGDIAVEALESGLSFSEETVIDVTLPVDGK
ncbi:MAG: cadherin domain-containing protein [Chloroflexota bacterium]